MGGCNGSGCNVRIRLRPRLLPTAFTAYCPLYEPMSADRPHSEMSGGAGGTLWCRPVSGLHAEGIGGRVPHHDSTMQHTAHHSCTAQHGTTLHHTASPHPAQLHRVLHSTTRHQRRAWAAEGGASDLIDDSCKDRHCVLLRAQAQVWEQAKGHMEDGSPSGFCCLCCRCPEGSQSSTNAWVQHLGWNAVPSNILLLNVNEGCARESLCQPLWQVRNGPCQPCWGAHQQNCRAASSSSPPLTTRHADNTKLQRKAATWAQKLV